MWGGNRDNSGRKRIYDDDQRKENRQNAKKKAKATLKIKDHIRLKDQGLVQDIHTFFTPPTIVCDVPEQGVPEVVEVKEQVEIDEGLLLFTFNFLKTIYYLILHSTNQKSTTIFLGFKMNQMLTKKKKMRNLLFYQKMRNLMKINQK